MTLNRACPQNVFIVDDHPVIRLAVRMLLEHEGYKVVGESDNGVDAMQMVRECMFEPFAQAQHTGPLARSGAGLGLVICRSLCEMMGGDLQLSSQPGVGTEVRVDLPMTPIPGASVREPAPPLVAPGQASLNVLVVDDHPANRLLLSQQLGFLGHRWVTANDGAQGLAAWQEGHFDLVIADCNMPVMNGYELSRAIRRIEQDEQRIPCTVLGFTANAQPEEKPRCRQAGMNDCLFKPISLATLSQCLETLQPFNQEPAFNLQSLQALTGGDPVLVRRLLTELLNSNRLDRQALLSLSPGCGREAFIDIAHKIKGAARIVQATRLMDSCEALERMCHEAFAQTRLASCTEAIQQAMLELERELERALQRELTQQSPA